MTTQEHEELGHALYCCDPRHETPCPEPCEACEDECDPQYLQWFDYDNNPVSEERELKTMTTQALECEVDKLLCEIQEFLRNVEYSDGTATGLTQDVEAIERQYDIVRRLSNARGITPRAQGRHG